MKSKKMISLTLAGMMVLPMVAYGSEDPLANLPETLGPENPVAATPEMYSNIDLSKKVNVNMIMVGDKPNDWEDVNEAINEYLEPFNTTLSATFLSWSDYTTLYPLELQGDEADIIYTANWCFLGSEAQKGSFVELTDDFIHDYMPLTEKYQAKDSYSEVLVGGKLYCLPQNMTEASSKFVAIRKDLADKYDIGEMKTWDEYTNYLTTIAEKETPESGIYAYAASGDNKELWDVYYSKYSYWTLVQDDFLQYKYMFDGTNAPKPEDIEFVYTGEIFRNFCTEMKKLADAGCWSRGALTNTTTDDESFGALQGASTAWNSSVFTYIKQAEETDGVECAVYDLSEGAPTSASYGTGGMALGSLSSNKERAAMILDIMKMDTTVNRLITLGIEGVHYEMIDETHYNELEKSKDFAIWTLAASWAIKNYKLVESGMDPRQQAIEAQIEAAGVVNPVRTFAFDDTEVADYATNIKNILKEFIPNLQLGMIDDVDAEIDKMMDQLNAAGLQEYEEALRTQYTEWYNAQ